MGAAVTERADVDALVAVLDELPPAEGGWSDELWDLYEVYEEGRTRRGPVPELDAGLAARFEAQWRRQELSGRVHGLLGGLRERGRGCGFGAPGEVAAVAVRLVRAGVGAHEAVNLLYDLGVPHGERALLGLVAGRGPGLGEGDVLWARERLFALRRGGYRARGERVPVGEEHLFPAAVCALPVGVGGGVGVPVDAALARAALEALLPEGPLAVTEPPPEWGAGWDDVDEEGERRPDWVEVRLLVRELMPDPWRVTRERMAEAERECGLLGLDGGEGDFAAVWRVRLASWLVGDLFEALGRGPDAASLAPWAMELAGEFARRGMAVEAARAFLERTGQDVPYSRQVLGGLSRDAGGQPPSATTWT